MSTRLLVLAAGITGLAWTAAITGIVFLAAPDAEAAWAQSGPGSAYAKADHLVAPGSLSITASKCTGNGNKTVSLSWPAIPLASSYEVYATDTSGGNRQKVATTSSTTVANLDLPYKPAVLTVHGTLGSWNGPYSPSATGCP